jgi:hypothetical protein
LMAGMVVMVFGQANAPPHSRPQPTVASVIRPSGKE